VPRYALLLRASANRVFREASFGLAAAELESFGARATGSETTVATRTAIAGVDYLVVDTDAPLDPAHRAVLANLSSLHAVYEIEDDGRLRPEVCEPRRTLPEDLVTIQRYTGKTNEAFTHLLVNVALAANSDALDRVLRGEPVRLLDPTCGRGTTLNRAALYGMDAFGIDIERRDTFAYETFLTTWLQDNRIKHSVARATHRKGRPSPAHCVTVTYRPPGGDVERVVDVVHDDARCARDHHKARSIDLLVSDLPYGVQHGSRSGVDRRARGPHDLLVEALPVWRDVLRPGGAAAMSWNRRTLERPALVALLDGAGFEVLAPEDERFVHRVDRSITRDVVVARRPVA
jgi:SAM-dependent methyltransferase